MSKDPNKIITGKNVSKLAAGVVLASALISGGVQTINALRNPSDAHQKEAPTAHELVQEQGPKHNYYIPVAPNQNITGAAWDSAAKIADYRNEHNGEHVTQQTVYDEIQNEPQNKNNEALQGRLGLTNPQAHEGEDVRWYIKDKDAAFGVVPVHDAVVEENSVPPRPAS